MKSAAENSSAKIWPTTSRNMEKKTAESKRPMNTDTESHMRNSCQITIFRKSRAMKILNLIKDFLTVIAIGICLIMSKWERDEKK